MLANISFLKESKPALKSFYSGQSGVCIAELKLWHWALFILGAETIH